MTFVLTSADMEVKAVVQELQAVKKEGYTITNVRDHLFVKLAE